jgi:anti-sigma regulatory factor (Ser/Thr protein kinase)
LISEINDPERDAPSHLAMKQTLQLLNDRREVAGLAQWVDRFAHDHGFPDRVRGNLQVALEEVALNVINHGYGEGGEARHFTVSLEIEGDFVAAVITDAAAAYDPLGRAEVDITLPLEQRPIGGLGIHLVKNLMDAVNYRRSEGRNVLTLHCRWKAAAEKERKEAAVSKT